MGGTPKGNVYSVYVHTTPDGKKYVGITRCDPKKRWGGGANYGRQEYFFDAIKRFGWENIKHEVVETGLTHEQANIKEREYIEKYNSSDPKYGYNISLGGDIPAKTTIEKWSLQRTGKTGADANRSKSVYQIEPNSMRIINKFVSAKEAEDVFGFKSNSISQTCRGRGKFPLRFYGGYFWSYVDEYDEEHFNMFKGISANANGKFTRPEWYDASKTVDARRKIGKSMSKPVMNIETGETYESLSLAAASVGCNVSTICVCLDRPTRTAAGYHWKRTERN